VVSVTVPYLSSDRDHDGLLQDAGDRRPHLQGPRLGSHAVCQTLLRPATLLTVPETVTYHLFFI
jgi:hypothetical protein